MTDEQTARERLIDKLADQMDRDNATAFVDEVIAEARRVVYCAFCGELLVAGHICAEAKPSA